MEHIISCIQDIAFLLTIKTRLHALELLGTPDIKHKHAVSRRAYESASIAKSINDFLQSTYNAQTKKSSWASVYSDLDNCLNEENTLNQKALADFYSKIEGDILYRVATLKKHVQTIMHEPAEFLLFQVEPQLHTSFTQRDASPSLYLTSLYPADKPFQFCKTPAIIRLDPIFQPSESVLDRPQVQFSHDSFDTNVEFFWNLAIRETFASEACAMSLFEYDGFPLDFYYDLAKQMWDEARHAKFYLDKSLSYFPAILQRDQKTPLTETIRNYQATGKLPVPKEKNFIDTFVDCTIEERLVLLNIRTEAPAVARLKEKINSEFSNQHKDIQESFVIDRIDEISHGAIGYKWLKFLYSDKELLQAKLDEVDNTRGLLLSISLAESSGKDYLQTINELMSDEAS